MDWAIVSGIVLAGVAVLGVILQALIYAYREGSKEQRLAAVEDRVRSMPQVEGMLSVLASELGGLKAQLTDVKTDLKSDIQEINHVIRNHLMARQKPGGGGG